MKISNRLKCISDMIDNGSNVIDIGCDHGLLDIYLTKYKKCNCIASDISENVLKNTKSNVTKYEMNNKIKIICSDGLKNIDIDCSKKNIIVISGMGTSTILNILNCNKLSSIDDMIIQSNNEINILRKEIIKLGFYIYDEKIINDSNKDYIVIYFKRGNKKYIEADYLFGPIIRKQEIYSEYFSKIYKKKYNIFINIPKKYIFKRLELYLNLKKLKKFTCIK